MKAKSVILATSIAALSALAIFYIYASNNSQSESNELAKKQAAIDSILDPIRYTGPFQECVKFLRNGSTEDIYLLYNFALSKKTMDIHLTERQKILFSGKSLPEISKSISESSTKISKAELQFHKETSENMLRRCKK